MIIIKFLLLVIAIFISLLWVMKLAIDFASSFLDEITSGVTLLTSFEAVWYDFGRLKSCHVIKFT